MEQLNTIFEGNSRQTQTNIKDLTKNESRVIYSNTNYKQRKEQSLLIRK